MIVLDIIGICEFDLFDLRSLLDDRCNLEALTLAHRATLCDLYFITHRNRVTIRICEELLRHAETLLVELVHHVAVHGYCHRVLHFRGADGTDLRAHGEGEGSKRKNYFFFFGEREDTGAFGVLVAFGSTVTEDLGVLIFLILS